MAERFDERPCRRFELDDRAEHAGRALRVGAALITVVAGGWLFALPYLAPRLFAVAGFVFAGLWLLRAARARSTQRRPAEHYLEFRPDALCLREGAQEQVVPWHEIISVAIDDDRLQVIVQRKSSAALVLEPQYRGLGLRPMAEAVQDALTRARQTELCTQAAHG
jgi:hypothetical protein